MLFLLPSVPEPQDAGAKMRNAGLLRLAGEAHTVDALAFGERDEQAHLAGLVRHAVVVPPPRRSTRARLADLVRSRLPDMALRLWSPDYLQALHTLLAADHYDAVHAEGIEMARYLRAVSAHTSAAGRPWRIYDAHNAEFLLQRRAFGAARASALSRGIPLPTPPPAGEGWGGGSTATPSRRARDLVAGAYSVLQWQRLKAFEAAAVRESDLTLAVSYHDADQLEALTPAARPRVCVVPNGIATARYPFREPAVDQGSTLLFLGKLDYRPNAEALAWLVEQVLPRLFARRPRARLFVVGHKPPAWLMRVGQHDSRVAVTGSVPDERPYLERATLFLLPMQVGGGSRLKALVAMASGVPIVSTRLGMEGLEAEPGRDFWLAESPDEWAQTLDHLLDDLPARRRLAADARELVERQYDWSAIRPALRQAYATLTGGA